MVNFTLHVTKPGDRADQTLAALAPRLGREQLVPDAYGRVYHLTDLAPAEAYALVTGSLDEIDREWEDYLHINPPR